MMKRLLFAALLLLPASAWAQPTNPLTRVFVIPISGDCETTPCSVTAAGKQMCRESATATTAFMCNGSSGFYDVGISGGAGAAGGANTQVQFNDSAAFGGDTGLTFNKATDALTVGGTLTSTLGNLVLSGAGATVDGKNLDFVPANSRIVHVCASGCEYSNVNTAIDSEAASTSSNPLTVIVHAGRYTNQITCSGHDYLSIQGEGPSTFIDVSGVVGEQGIVDMGTCTNWTIANMRIKGHRAITGEWAGANAGDITLYDLDIGSEGVAADEDCGWFDQPGSGSSFLFRDNRCNTNADGFTLNAGGAGVEWTSIGNIFNRYTGVTLSGYMHAFEGIPCRFTSIGDVAYIDGDYNQALTAFVQFNGAETGCASGAVATITGAKVYMNNTEATLSGSMKFVDILSNATEVGTINLIANDVEVSQGAAGGSAVGVDLGNATTRVNVYGGRYRSSGPGAAQDFKVGGGGAGGNGFRLFATDYVTETAAGSEIQAGDIKKLLVGTSALFTSPARITYTNSTNDEVGLLLDNTDSVSDETSPWLQMCNGGASEECWSWLIQTNGRLGLRNPSGTQVMDFRTGGNAVDFVASINMTNKFGQVKLGDGTNSDSLNVQFDSGTTDATLQWNDTANRLDLTGPETVRLASITTNPTLGTAGDFSIDTTANQWLYYSGGAIRVLSETQCKGLDIETPTTSTDPILLKAPYGMTITDIDCIVDPADASESATIALGECDGTGDSCAGVDGATTIVCDNDGAADDGSLSNADIDSGDWINLDVSAVSGTVTRLSVTWCFTAVRQ